MVAAAVEPEKLVFVDECGTHTSLAPIYGYAPKGERLRLSVPRNRGKKHDTALQHDDQRDGSVFGGGRFYHGPSL